MYDEWESYLQYKIVSYPGEGYVCSISVSWLPGMRSSFADLRFSDGAGSKLSYWIEQYTAFGYAVVRIKLGKSNIVFLHYGNPSAKSESDGSSVFDFFDDFSSTTVDTATKWLTEGGGTYTLAISNGVLNVSGNSGYARITKKTALTSSAIIEQYSKYNNSSNAQRNRFNAPINASVDSGIFGTDVFFGSIVGTVTTGTYYKIIHKWIPSSLYTFNVVGIGSWTNTSNVVSTYSPGIFAGDGSGTYMYGDSSTDWIAIRKYVATDPTAVMILSGTKNDKYLKIASELPTPNLFEMNIPKVSLRVTRTSIRIWSSDTAHEDGTMSRSAVYREWLDVVKYRIDNHPGADYICVFNLKWLPGMRSDFSDIRFSDERGTSLTFYIDSYTSHSTARVLVKLTSANTVYLHYGNPSAKNGSSSSLFTYFDDFSTDTSANYTIQDSATKVYDSTNRCIKQTNTGSAQHWIVCNADNNNNDVYTYEAKYRINSDTASRNHGGAILEWSTSAKTGYRVTHIDSLFVNSHYTANVETGWTNSSVADTNIYADDRWVTYRVYRNRLTGYTKITYIYGSYSATFEFPQAYNKLYTNGHPGLHSYGCQTWWTDIKIWKSAAVEPVPVIIGNNHAFNPTKLLSEISTAGNNYIRDSSFSVNVAESDTSRTLNSLRPASSNLSVNRILAERELDTIRNALCSVAGFNVISNRDIKRESSFSLTISELLATRILESIRESSSFTQTPYVDVFAGAALMASALMNVVSLYSLADSELSSDRETGHSVSPAAKAVTLSELIRESKVSTHVETLGSEAIELKRESSSYIASIKITCSLIAALKRNALSSVPTLESLAFYTLESERGADSNITSIMLSCDAVVYKAGSLVSGAVKKPISKSVIYSDFESYSEYTIQNYPGKDFLCVFTVSWLPGMSSDFRDVRFTDQFDVKLPYYIESYTAFSSAKVLVKLGTTPTVIMYYGNGTAKSESTTSVFTYFDDFSTDTSAKYNVLENATKTYDSTNKCLKQTNTSTSTSHWLVCNSDILPSSYIYECKVKVTGDTASRNHGGVVIDFSTSSLTGYRLTHLDNVFVYSKYSSGVESGSTSFADTDVYADDRWLTYRIFRDRSTGTIKFTVTYESYSATQTFTDTSHTTGHIGIHSYGCQTWWDNIRVWKAAETEPIPVLGSSGLNSQFMEIVVVGHAYTVQSSVITKFKSLTTYNIHTEKGSDVTIPAIEELSDRALHFPRVSPNTVHIFESLGKFISFNLNRQSLISTLLSENALRNVSYFRSPGMTIPTQYESGDRIYQAWRYFWDGGIGVYLPTPGTTVTKVSHVTKSSDLSVPAPSVLLERYYPGFIQKRGAANFVNTSEILAETVGGFERVSDNSVPGVSVLVNPNARREVSFYIPALEIELHRGNSSFSIALCDLGKIDSAVNRVGQVLREKSFEILPVNLEAYRECDLNRSSETTVTVIDNVGSGAAVIDRISDVYVNNLTVDSSRIAETVRVAAVEIPVQCTITLAAANYDHLHQPYEIMFENSDYVITIDQPEYGVILAKNLYYAVVRDGNTMIEITQFDTDTFSASLQDTDPTTDELRAMPLTGKDVKVVLKGGAPDTTVVVDCTVIEDGKVEFRLSSNDTSVSGKYILKFVITGAGFRKELPENRDDYQEFQINDASYIET